MTTSLRAGRNARVAVALAVVLLMLGCSQACGQNTPAPSTSTAPSISTEPVGALELLTDPFLQMPERNSVEVAWFTEFAGDSHHVLVGEAVGAMSETDLQDVVTQNGAPGVEVVKAESMQLSRVAEDSGSQLPAEAKPATGIAARQVFRHHAVVAVPGADRLPYRVVSTRGDQLAGSGTFSLRGALEPGEPAVILLTSDLQLQINTAANLELAARTITDELGRIDAVFMPGDLVNVADRASDWFDDQRGSAFFPTLQGNGGRQAGDGKVYRGGEIIQNAPLYPAIGNHEVQGRIEGHSSLVDSSRNPVPRVVAEGEYLRVSDVVNPTGDPAVKAQWIEDNSFSTTTHEEIVSLPGSGTGGERYCATTVGDVRLVHCSRPGSIAPPRPTLIPPPAATPAATRRLAPC